MRVEYFNSGIMLSRRKTVFISLRSKAPLKFEASNLCHCQAITLQTYWELWYLCAQGTQPHPEESGFPLSNSFHSGTWNNDYEINKFKLCLLK